MINVSKAFRRMLYENKRNYKAYADVTLESGTVLELENEDLLMGGFSREDAVSSDESFSALGSAAIGSASIIINDLDESYSDYDFTNATVVLYVALDVPNGNSTIEEKIKLGTYTVDDPGYRGTAITLSMLDNMERFDRPYSGSTLTYPASLYTIVSDACTKCGVTLGTLNFPHKDYMIQTRPDDEATTFRDVISWAAAVAGCFARCDADGELELKWFNQTALESRSQGYDGGEFDDSTPYDTGDDVDGGSFNPWTTGDAADGGDFTSDIPLHYIYGLFSQNISVDDVVITGVRIIIKNDDVEAVSGSSTYQIGTDGYVIEVSENGFITSNNVTDILTWLSTQLIGLRFRKAVVTHSSDPSIEAGDVGILWDRKGREHPILITRVTFGIGTSQTIACGAETPSRNSATRYSAQTKAYVENRKILKKERSSWEAAQEILSNRIANAAGLYSTDVVDEQTLAVTHYLHNKADLEDSDILIMVSDAGITMTANALDTTPTWYGLTVDGTLLASVINTMQLFFDYAHGGTLTLGGDANVNGLLIMLDASGTEIGRWSKDGISAINASISGVLTAGAGSNIAGLYTNANGIYSSNYSSIDSYSISGRSGYFFGNDGRISLKTTGGSILRLEDTSFGIFAEASSGANSGVYVALFLNNGVNGGDYGLKISKSSYSAEMTEKIFTIGNNTGNFVELNTNTGTYRFDGGVVVNGSAYVTGTKTRLVKTDDYGNRLLYCYETPTPMFGDIGEGVIGDDGLCYISLDPVFAETISTTQYQVFLQRYGSGDAFVKERHGSYFVVQGSPGLEFGWEIKAKQAWYEMLRLDRKTDVINMASEDYADMAVAHISDITRERTGEAA